MRNSNLEELRERGFCWFRGAFDSAETIRLREDVDALAAKAREEAPGEREPAGIRIAPSEFAQAQEIVDREHWRNFLSGALGGRPRLVRIILFDKSDRARWWLRFHRDTMIPVREHRPSRVLTAPSVKEGVPHVRATAEILSRMLAIRVHFDPADESNGALRVIPGTHRIEDLENAAPPPNLADIAETCEAEAGDVLMMRPLLLHGSPKPTAPEHRRVLHLEVTGPQALPDGFEWFGV